MRDLRTPIGMFFAIIGATLCLLGLIKPDLPAPLLEVNINLYAGAVMLIFGGVMLWLARPSRSHKN